jgi:hypothetical protein
VTPPPIASAAMKLAVQYTTARAIAAGTLVRAKRCEHCKKIPRTRDGKRVVATAHHEDYDAPLSVTWLCPSCHQRRHSAINREWKALNTRCVHCAAREAAIAAALAG